MSEAVVITALGMGGVFVLLILLIFVLHIVEIAAAGGDARLEKISAAIACARRGGE
ncbi:MAG: hypothetical protein PHX68_03935 [Alphaproteobacteria bacterium]|nr:hypothetical protein [Alphaproteobacteria bacterium]